MSFLFNREKEMLEAKKKRTFPVRSTEAEERVESENTEATEESMPESWVELAPSRASLCSSVEAVNMDEESSSIFNTKDSRLSPISLQSPAVELESNLEQVKYRLAKDVAPKDTDWIWDWSSRPEAMPSSGSTGAQSLQQIASALTTPPNSPEPDLLLTSGRSIGGAFDFASPLRPRRPAKKQSLLSSLLRFEVIFGLVVSNIVTFVIGASIGFCVCRRMRKSDADSIIRMSSYNYNRW